MFRRPARLFRSSAMLAYPDTMLTFTHHNAIDKGWCKDAPTDVLDVIWQYKSHLELATLATRGEYLMRCASCYIVPNDEILDDIDKMEKGCQMELRVMVFYAQHPGGSDFYFLSKYRDSKAIQILEQLLEFHFIPTHDLYLAEWYLSMVKPPKSLGLPPPFNALRFVHLMVAKYMPGNPHTKFITSSKCCLWFEHCYWTHHYSDDTWNCPWCQRSVPNYGHKDGL